MSAADFGTAFKGFLEQAVQTADEPEPVFSQLLRSHFESEPATLPIVGQAFEASDHPNVQVALDVITGREGCEVDLLGIGSSMTRMLGIGFGELVTPTNAGAFGSGGPKVGPVEYTTVTLDQDQTISCVQTGLFLLREGGRRVAMLVRGPGFQGVRPQVVVEVMAGTREVGEAVLAELRTLVREHSVYRGRIVALSAGRNPGEAVSVQFQRLPDVSRDDVILPDETLARVERHTIGVARQRARLRAAGQHLKRGLLLHGPPGTGKTLSAMYLITQMRDRTTLLLTGRTQGLIPQACAMARMLQPALVVLEDVDLVAEERTHEGACGPVLFELLNEMDGLADDADVIFLLTTNRADLLEPALAARPGRIDLAVHVPLPDESCRRRLFDLYGHGLQLELGDRKTAIARTEGVSASFIKELLRKAALLAADDDGGDPLTVTDAHVADALRELVVDGGALTRNLLGASEATGGGDQARG